MVHQFSKPAVITLRQARIHLHLACSYVLITSWRFHGATAPRGSGPPHYPGLNITVRPTTLGRTSLDEWWGRRKHIYLITHDAHKPQNSITLAGFEPAIPASEQPQTHALECAATVIGQILELHLLSRALFFLRQLITCFNYGLQEH
jgi:hypothetical protein